MLFLLSFCNIALGTNFWNFGLITLVGRTSAAGVLLEAPNLGLATSTVTSAGVHSWDFREMIKENKNISNTKKVEVKVNKQIVQSC